MYFITPEMWQYMKLSLKEFFEEHILAEDPHEKLDYDN